MVKLNSNQMAREFLNLKILELLHLYSQEFHLHVVALSQKKPEKPIEPGDEGEIEVEYDTKREGLFMKAISVVSNSKNPSTILRIKGEVLPEEEEEEEEEEKGKD